MFNDVFQSAPCRSPLAATLLVVLFAAPALAQNESAPPELITDRPDFTESSEVVGRGAVQLESGFVFEHVDESLRQITLPQLLVRVGVGSRVELRFASDGFIAQSRAGIGGRTSHRGHADTEVGAKFKLLDADRAGVDFAIISAISLPTASSDLGSGGYDPGVKLTVARDLPREFGLSANLNFASLTEGNDRVFAREASLSMSHPLGGPFGSYGEVYGSFDGSGCSCVVNGGVTMALGANRQVDVEVGHGVSGDAQGWFVGFGFAVRRLPH